MAMKFRLIVLFALVTAGCGALIAAELSLMPPGWKDTSTEIETWIGLARSCGMEGYWWSKTVGPDFEVYNFENGEETASSAGFYLGDHPATTLAVTPRDKGTEFGELMGHTALWIKRSRWFSSGIELETRVHIPKTKAAGRELEMHFWVLPENEGDISRWLEWAECFELDFDSGETTE